MNIINKSLVIAKKVFPQIYKKNGGGRTYHFCFLWRRNKLLTFQINRIDKPLKKALNLSKHFKIPSKHLRLCSEWAAISMLFGHYWITNKVKAVIFRLNRFGLVTNSKPCENCSKILNIIGIKAYYSNDNENFDKLEN